MAGYFNFNDCNLKYVREEIKEILKKEKTLSNSVINELKVTMQIIEVVIKKIENVDNLMVGYINEDQFVKQGNCYVDEHIEVYDHCVLNTGMPKACPFANENDIKNKKDCPYWR